MENWGIISLLIGALYITPFIFQLSFSLWGFSCWHVRYWGIKAGKEVGVVFAWNEKTQKWLDELPPETQAAINNGSFETWISSWLGKTGPPPLISLYFWGGYVRGGWLISHNFWRSIFFCVGVWNMNAWWKITLQFRPLKLSDFEDGMPAVANCFSSGWAVLLDFLDHLFPARISQDSPGGQPGFFPFLGTFFPATTEDYTQLFPQQANLYASLQEWSLRQSQAKKV